MWCDNASSFFATVRLACFSLFIQDFALESVVLFLPVLSILEFARSCGLLEVDEVFYCHKTYLWPEKQLLPHSSFQMEVCFLLSNLLLLVNFSSHRSQRCFVVLFFFLRSVFTLLLLILCSFLVRHYAGRPANMVGGDAGWALQSWKCIYRWAFEWWSLEFIQCGSSAFKTSCIASTTWLYTGDFDARLRLQLHEQFCQTSDCNWCSYIKWNSRTESFYINGSCSKGSHLSTCVRKVLGSMFVIFLHSLLFLNFLWFLSETAHWSWRIDTWTLIPWTSLYSIHVDIQWMLLLQMLITPCT